MDQKVLAQFREDLEAIYSEFIECLRQREHYEPNVPIEKAVIAAADAITALNQVIEKLEGIKMVFFSRKRKPESLHVDQVRGLAERLKKVQTEVLDVIKEIDSVDWYSKREQAMRVKTRLQSLVGGENVEGKKP